MQGMPQHACTLPHSTCIDQHPSHLPTLHHEASDTKGLAGLAPQVALADDQGPEHRHRHPVGQGSGQSRTQHAPPRPVHQPKVQGDMHDVAQQTGDEGGPGEEGGRGAGLSSGRRRRTGTRRLAEGWAEQGRWWIWDWDRQHGTPPAPDRRCMPENLLQLPHKPAHLVSLRPLKTPAST